MKDKISIGEIQIIPIKAAYGLIGFASLVINDDFYLGSIGIHSRLGGGFRLTYPTKLVSGKNINIYHPINKNASEAIQQAVIGKYKEVMKGIYENTNENEVKTF